MSLEGDYDHANIFAKILRGEAPAYRIFENEDALAFLDLFPQSRGHALVLPKRPPARTMFDMTADELAALYGNVHRVARAVRDELRPDGVQLMQFNGAPSGQTVFHVHVHVIPRWEGEGLGIHARGKADPAELEALSVRLSARLAEDVGD